jgi:hypothetical protein
MLLTIEDTQRLGAIARVFKDVRARRSYSARINTVALTMRKQLTIRP